jgi:hypothetical protein
MGLDSLYQFSVRNKILLLNIFLVLLLSITVIVVQLLKKKKPLEEVLKKVSDFLLMPYPKTTGWGSRFFVKILNNSTVTILNNLFYKIKDEKFIIVLTKEPWAFVNNYIIDNDENLTTAIYKNYGILFIKKQEESYMEEVFNQLSSYDPWPQKIFINYGININYKQFQDQLTNLFLKHFTQMMAIIIVYNNDNSANSYFDKSMGIDYQYLKNSDDVLSQSLNNGFLMDSYHNGHRWESQLQSVGGSIEQVVLFNNQNLDDDFLNVFSGSPSQFKNKNYLKFWNNFYLIVLGSLMILGSIQGVLDYLEYKKIYKVVGTGKKIINESESIQDADDFLNSLSYLDTSRITFVFKAKSFINQFFSQVYSSSIFNIYEKKIQKLQQSIENDAEDLATTKPIHTNGLGEVNYLIIWKSMVVKIGQLHKLIEEFNQIIKKKNYYDQYGNESKNTIIEKTKNLIAITQLEIQQLLMGSLKIIIKNILNPDLLEKKQQLHNTLRVLTNYYSQKNSPMGLEILHVLLKQDQEFINEINKDIYKCLDNNQWRWPFEEDIEFLESNNFLGEEYHQVMAEYHQKLINYKKELGLWNKTFLSPINGSFTRKSLLNSGTTNLITIENQLNKILGTEIIQILENNNCGPINSVDYNNKLIVWDLEKMTILQSIAGFYKDFLDQWNGLSNNGFLLTVRKITDYNIGQLFEWMVSDGFVIEKFNNNYKSQYENFQSMVALLKEIKLKNFYTMVPSIKTLLIYQINSIGKMFLNFFESQWFSQLNGASWKGEGDILLAIMGIDDINKLTQLFSNGFESMDNLITNNIMPFLQLVMAQNIIEEDQIPYVITQLTDISTQIVLYKNGQDNHLKALEKQILEYKNMKNYDLFKLNIKDGFSDGNVFIIAGSTLHNQLVSKAKITVENQQMKDYQNLVKFFNDKCFNKIPFNVKGKGAVSFEDIKTLKKLLDKCKQCQFIFEKNPLEYQEHWEWLQKLQCFFNGIEIVSTGIRVNYNVNLQTVESSAANNNLIMRWHSNVGNKETTTNKELTGTITNNDKWEILMDVVNDNSISVVEFDKIVPLNRGCLIFSNDQWGFWRFIGKYLFKENENDFILQIKIPIIVKTNGVQQQWIIAYVQVKKIPQVVDRGPWWNKKKK